MPICEGALCIMRAAVPSDFALCLPLVVVGYSCYGVICGPEGVALLFPLGAYELLGLACCLGFGSTCI